MSWLFIGNAQSGKKMRQESDSRVQSEDIFATLQNPSQTQFLFLYFRKSHATLQVPTQPGKV